MRTGPGPKADGGGCAAGARPEGRRQRVCTGPGPKAAGARAPTSAGRPRHVPAGPGQHTRGARECPHLAAPLRPAAKRGRKPAGSRPFTSRRPDSSASGKKAWTKIGPAPRAAGRPRHLPATPVPEPSHSDASRLTTARTADPGQPTHRPRMSTPRGPHSPRREAWTQTGRFGTIHVPTSQQLRVRRKAWTKIGPAPHVRGPTTARTAGPGPPPAQDALRLGTPAGSGPPQAQDPREARNLPQARRRPGSTGPRPGATTLRGDRSPRVRPGAAEHHTARDCPSGTGAALRAE